MSAVMTSSIVYAAGSLLCGFIGAMLGVFLLLGQCSSSPSFSDVYMAELQYNRSAPFISQLNSSITTASLRLGYRGACLVYGTQVNCTDYQTLAEIPGLGVNVGKVSISLASIGSGWHKSTHYQLILAAVLISLVQLLVRFYLLLPRAPKRCHVSIISGGFGGIELILFGATALVHHATVSAAAPVAEAASNGIVVMTRGVRANTITWTCIAFSMLSSVLMVGLAIRPKVPAPARSSL